MSARKTSRITGDLAGRRTSTRPVPSVKRSGKALSRSAVRPTAASRGPKRTDKAVRPKSGGASKVAPARPATARRLASEAVVGPLSRRVAAKRAIAAKKAAAVKRAAPPRIDAALAAAWRMRRQRLDVPSLRPPDDLAATLSRGGWLLSPTGSTPYLALAARYAGFARTDLDRAVFQEGILAEVPGMRGVTMVVPAEEAWIPLQAHAPRARAVVEDLVRRKGLLRVAELRNLQDVVRAILAGRPLGAEALVQKVPSRLVKDLGESGRRHGAPTSVDLALRDLIASGDVVPMKVDRRLDRSRVEFTLRRDLHGPMMTADVRPRPPELFTAALADRYFRWVGPARLSDFAWWAGLPLHMAQQAARELGLVPVALAGLKGEWYLPPGGLEDISVFRPPEPPGVALIPFQDPLTAAWPSFDALIDPDDLKRPLVGFTGKTIPAGESGPAGANHHFIIVGGRVAGAWEHGSDGVLRYATFSGLPAEVDRLLAARAAATAEFVASELGEARTHAASRGRDLSLEAAARDWAGPASTVNRRPS